MFSHIKKNNQPGMVDVSEKDITHRVAKASALVKLPDEIKNLINIIFDKNDTIENNIKNNFVESSEILEIKEVIEFLNSNSKRGITTFEND